MVKIGIYEARVHFSEVINRVTKGAEITLTRHGTPVAELVPVSPANGHRKASVAKAIAELRQFRKHKLRGLSIKKLIEEGRM